MFPSLAGTRAKKLRKRFLWEWNEFGSKCKRPPVLLTPQNTSLSFLPSSTVKYRMCFWMCTKKCGFKVFRGNPTEIQDWHIHYFIQTKEINEGISQYIRDNADENAENPPFHRELGCLCKLVEKFHNYKLKCHSDHYNWYEEIVLMNAFKHIQLLWPPGIDLIEKLTENKCIEDNGILHEHLLVRSSR
jgi:hypothetical protein